MTTELWTIGDFARESGLTPKALRLYDDLGLLRPVEVDASSGYRRYAPEQLAQARLVAALRLVGMPLARIEEVLGASPAAAARLVRAYWLQVERDTASRRDIVSALVDQLESEEPPMTTATDTLHAEIGTSHRTGGRTQQQDALVATPTLLAVADGYGERAELSAEVLAAALCGAAAAACEAIRALVFVPPVAGSAVGSDVRLVHA
ncbi:MAG: MerR family transcriptional regulator, partial [Blastococcus sp.]|nr:MerR family transcriptional regulator [Blastococcus sp.]